jgi:hypothetical protein
MRRAKSSTRWRPKRVRTIIEGGTPDIACTRAVSTLPLMVVDESHNGLDQGAQRQPIIYALPPAGGLVVDPGAYTFPYRSDFKSVGPNAIHLLAGSNRKYKVLWDGPPHRAVLDPTTLVPLAGSEPFGGFVTGETLIIVIGNDRPDNNAIEAMWMGMAKVK